uniref:RRP15-like protein n=1 Tax=Denticeps clupeoides TaxID=299321 RepID=A0AAY4AJG6_9TELE
SCRVPGSDEDLDVSGNSDADEESSEGAEDVSSEGGFEEERREDEGPKDQENPNAGWAEAMAKVLQKKTPESRPTILLRNKTLDKVKEKEKKEQLERKKQIDKKREWEMMCREKPDVVRDKEKERNLQRIATRGVVQLFNAVQKHKKNIDKKVSEAGGSERKKAKILSSVSKKDFIDVLRGTTGRTKTNKAPAWNVLRDDFMMGASMKDWDKESDEEGSK